jgi:hypothetical protein
MAEVNRQTTERPSLLQNILQDVGSEMKRLGVQGQMEAASLLFNGSAFVAYGPGQYTPSPTPEHSQEQERNLGRER